MQTNTLEINNIENYSIKNNNIEKIINSLNDPTDNITTTLNQYEKEYLMKMFTKNDSLIVDLHHIINEILEDNKVDFHDIPNIILFTTKIYSTYFSGHNYKLDPVNIIKFIAEAIIFSYIKSLTINDIVIINKLIDISLELLKVDPKIFNLKYNICNLLCKKRN
jgi:hypothetical protein